jgi:hypothetical protein
LNSTLIPFESPLESPTAIANWCSQVLNPSAPTVTVAEQLRSVFEMREAVLLCVECVKRPSEIPEGVPCFLVKRSALAFFAPNVEEGIYLYRPKDRQLVKYKGDFEEERKTVIKSIADDFETKEFVCGYLLDFYEYESELFVQNLIDLSVNFSGEFDFLLVHRDDSAELLQRGRFFRQRPPFFFVMKSGRRGAKRWYLERENARDLSRLSVFLSRIVAGTEPYTITHNVVQEGTGPFQEVNALGLEALVSEEGVATLVLLVSAPCPYCKEFKPVVEVVAELVDQKAIRIVWMNGPANDVPDVIPVTAYYPALLLWPIGGKEAPPIEFRSENRTVSEVIDFIAENARVDGFERPVFDAEAIEKKVAALRSQA